MPYFRMRIYLFVVAVAWGSSASVVHAQAAYAWGLNTDGALGNGTTTNSSTPVAVIGQGIGITSVASGYFHSLFLNNGAVYAVGYNGLGQLGNGTINTTSTPVAVTGMTSGVTAVAAGIDSSLAIRNGALYGWGYNAYGQLGIGSTSAVIETATVAPGFTSGVTAIAAGNNHSLAIMNGAAYAFGQNTSGQLGNGTTTNSISPVAVTGLSSGVTAISGGNNHSLAVQNGAVYAWGDNAYGELGNGTTTSTTTPVAVPSLGSGVTAVSAGSQFSLALKGGVVYAWGANSFGQLGNGTTNFSVINPVAVSGLPSNVTEIAASATTSYALTSTHVLYAWGDNDDGQFGNGTTTNSNVPLLITPPSGYNFVGFSSTEYTVVAILLPTPEPTAILVLALAALLFANRICHFARRRCTVGNCL